MTRYATTSTTAPTPTCLRSQAEADALHADLARYGTTRCPTCGKGTTAEAQARMNAAAAARANRARHTPQVGG